MRKQIAVVSLLAGSLPVVGNAAALLELDAYVAHTKAEYSVATPPASFETDGEGGGLRARVNLPLTGAFLTAEYQTGSTDGDIFGQPLELDLTQHRLGLGTELEAGPVSVLGRIEYTHINADFSAPGGGTASENEDGFGAHVGVDAGIGIAGVYASAGYLKLTDADGTEFTVGGRFSVIPTLAVFAEYRLTDLDDTQINGTPLEYSADDFRVGIKFDL